MTIPTAEPTGAPYDLGTGDGPALWHMGARLTFKATSRATEGRLWVQEAYGGRGYASPLHRHTQEDEAFYVLEGRLAAYAGEEVVTAEPGGFVWAPRGVAHAFCVESDEARFLAFSSGGEMDRFFFETGTPAVGAALPPPADGPPDVEALARAMGTYGVELTGPPPEPRG
jgi:quercetin dioxygenase-like cupin family protein